MNPALWEMLLSAVLILEIPALLSSLFLGLYSLRLRPRPRGRWVALAMLVGLTVPWAGMLFGLILGLLLRLIFSDFWIPLLAGITIGVLYLQLRWTLLILAEWRESASAGETSKESEPEVDQEPEESSSPT